MRNCVPHRFPAPTCALPHRRAGGDVGLWDERDPEQDVAVSAGRERTDEEVADAVADDLAT
ncbi:MAG: hypothetical protein IAG13_16965 [Deltaproteobacteria bacterium]|nr:hypothetical protein [Nannocystaceae bacterium]